MPDEAKAETCWGSTYGPGLFGNLTASGSVYTGVPGTVAHKYYPFGTTLYVENLWTGAGAYLVVDDRGPYIAGRCVDVSWGSGWIVDYGVAPVEVTVVSY